MQFKRSVLEEIKNDIGIAAPFTPSGNESLVWPLGNFFHSLLLQGKPDKTAKTIKSKTLGLNS